MITDLAHSAKKRATLTGCVLTRNSEQRLGALLDRLLSFCDEVIVGVDSTSTDSTSDVALGKVDRVFSFSHAGQLAGARMLPFKLASNDWVFSIDDDESLEDHFEDFLLPILEMPVTHAWFARKWVVNLDPPQYLIGEQWYPDWQLRLIRNDVSLVRKPNRPHSGYCVVGPGHREERAAILHFEPVLLTAQQRAAKVEWYLSNGATPESTIQFLPRESVGERAFFAFPRPREPEKVRQAKSEQVLHYDVSGQQAVGWNSEFISVSHRGEVRAGERLNAKLCIRNTGSLAWFPPNLHRPTILGASFHLLNKDGTIIKFENARIQLDRAVPPGEEVTVYASFDPFMSAGEYILEWDMVSEGECWFADCGSKTFRSTLNVVSATEVTTCSRHRLLADTAQIFATTDDREFVRSEVNAIPGWLGDFVSLRTMELMRMQLRFGGGPVLEIGVYAGRYLSVLYREAVANGDVTFGIDTFDRIDEATVRTNLGVGRTSPDIVFLPGRSVEYDADRLREVLKAKVRFVSLDGSHLYEDVTHDIALADSVLASNGIIACDDFLNPVRLGVGQAVHEALQHRNLVPFGYVQNKLFLCRKALHREYFEFLMECCSRDETSNEGRLFAQQTLSAPSRNRTTLYGWDLAVVP